MRWRDNLLPHVFMRSIRVTAYRQSFLDTDYTENTDERGNFQEKSVSLRLICIICVPNMFHEQKVGSYQFGLNSGMVSEIFIPFL